MKVMLTGSSGMVGRNILEHKNSTAYQFLTPTSKELDLTDRIEIELYLSEHCPDLIIHCAGLVGGIQANISRPVDFLQKNTLMGVNLVSCAYEQGIPKFLNMASSCMYPRNGRNPLREDQLFSGELEPTNEGYALAKLVTTRLCEYVCKQDPQLIYRTLIPCNLYGRFDHFESTRSHLIPAIIQKIDQAMSIGEPFVEIWGDGMARREFMFAEDLADFIFFAIPLMEQLPNNMNVGLGSDYTIKEYYRAAALVMGFDGEFSHNLSKPVGMRQKVVDTSVQSRLGWSPKTSLDLGLSKTVAFYRQQAVKNLNKS
jgi:GDP-L-fucose synthase